MNATFICELERLVVAQICNCFETVNVAAADALAEMLSSLGSTFSQVVQNAAEFEVPFAHTLPLRLQIRRLPKRAPAFRELGDPALPHFPKFLPALPDEHTFRRTPGQVSSAPEAVEAGASGGHKPLEDALGGLKRTNDTCKRKRFGEYEARPYVDDVASRQYNMWQTSFTSDNVESSKDKTRESTHALKKPTTVASTNNFKCPPHMTSALREGTSAGTEDGGLKVSRGKVEFDLNLRKKSKTSDASQIQLSQSLNVPFREHSTLSNADYETVDKLVKGHISVFEST